jgi:hypothetical protein
LPSGAENGKEGIMNRNLSSLCILALTLVFLCGSAFAKSSPINAGRKMLSGNFVFSSMGGDLYESLDGDRATLIEFCPSVNYFVIPHLAVGGKLSVARASQGDSSDTSLGIGPQLLYFIGDTEPRDYYEGVIYPFLGASLLYTRNTAKMEWLGETTESTDSLITIGLGGGVCVMLSDTIGFVLEANLAIDNMKPEEGDSIGGNRINLLAGIAAFGY